MNRRNFMKNTGLASVASLVPQFVNGFGTNGITANGKNLVIIQWSGGNDGLNTLVPFRNDLYYKKRPTINIPKKSVLKINDELGFNPVMKDFRSLYDDGLMSIINNVGYPNPNRSHFRSMDIWHTASNSNQFWSTGWLGRYLDEAHETSKAHTILEIDETLELALKGASHSGFAAADFKKLQKTTQNPFLQKVAHHHDHAHEENVAYLYKTLIETQNSADYLFEKSKIYKSSVTYPRTDIGKDLNTVANLIMGNADTKIYYVNLGSFDTHANQRVRQNRLLKQYSEAVTAFVKDLKQNNKIDDTLIMTFSEFGRRVNENGSKGTDHGTANNIYLIGGKLKNPGVFNEDPNLSSLKNGDLIYSVDFREIYASILKQWLNVEPKSVLNRTFKPLNLIK